MNALLQLPPPALEALCDMMQAATALMNRVARHLDALDGAAPSPPRRETAAPAPAATRSPEPEPAALAGLRDWSAERDAILRRDYPANVPLGTILERVNALPGPRIAPKKLSNRCVVSLHLRRSVAAVQSPTPVSISPAISRQARALADAAAVMQKPVVATKEQILFWNGQHGLSALHLDLVETNAKRRRIGLAPFQLADNLRAPGPRTPPTIIVERA